MENRFRNLLLSLVTLINCVICTTAFSADNQSQQDSVLIQPEIQRVAFDEAQIDGDDFEIMLFVGYLSIEDFGVNPLLAAKLNYYVNESVFVQLTLAQSNAGESSYEILSGGAPLLTDAERELKYYTIDIGFNLLPGEAFLDEQTAYNTAFYLSAGIGNTEFAGSDRFTIDYGAGYRLLLNDEFSLTMDFRNMVFDVDVFGENKVTNNLQFLIGFGWFF
jgi:outer membrane beta-barrel protein